MTVKTLFSTFSTFYPLEPHLHLKIFQGYVLRSEIFERRAPICLDLALRVRSYFLRIHLSFFLNLIRKFKSIL